jgi:hypothetical protein
MDISLDNKTNVYTPPATLELDLTGIDLSQSGIDNSVCEGGFLSFCEDVNVQYRGNFTNIHIEDVKVEINFNSKNYADSHDDNSINKIAPDIGHGNMAPVKLENSGSGPAYGGGRYGFPERPYLQAEPNQQ